MPAIFTLLYDTNYVPGALLLGAVLKDMIPADMTLGLLIDKRQLSEFQLHLLEDIYHHLQDISVIKSGFTDKLTNDLKRPELDKTFSKIHLWNLPYDKILYLDCDTLPNPDSNLLDLLTLELDKGKIYASPDAGFPDIFNSGMFVIRPNQQDYHNLKQLVTGSDDITFDGADQGLLNQYFNSDPDWVAGVTPSNWVKLPFLYNVTPNTQYEYAPAYSHFNSSSSPSVDTATTTTNSDSSLPESDASASASASAAYSYTATSFYGRKIKLVHYIGPVKPWSTYNPGTAEWWRLWHKYFDHDTFTVQDKFATADSVWNPAVSAPPKRTAAVTAAPATTASATARAPTKSPTKSPTRSPTSNSPKSSPQIKSILKKKLATFGYHPEQIPERVFPSPKSSTRSSTRSSPSGSPNSISNVSKKLDSLKF